MGYDIITSILFGILYNMFFHKFANFYYKDMSFDNRYRSSIVMLFMAGILGVIVGKSYLNKYLNNKISDGIAFGGFFLIISALVNNWTYMSEITKIVLIIFAMTFIAYNSSKNDGIYNSKQKLEEHTKKIKIV